MASFNKVIIMGRLVADPELKHTANGTAVTSFSIAVDRRYSNANDKKTDFINVAAWKQNAEFICKYFAKGSPIIVCGELHTRSYKDANGNTKHITEVVASEAAFAESKKSAEANASPAGEAFTEGNVGAYTADEFEAVQDEDLPF